VPATVFSKDCDNLQAIIISDADLEVVGEEDTGTLRDGDDFGCGDTIIFTFDLIDFDITVESNRADWVTDVLRFKGTEWTFDSLNQLRDAVGQFPDFVFTAAVLIGVQIAE